MHACVCAVCVHVYMYVCRDGMCMCVGVHKCVHVCVCVHVHACVCACVSAYVCVRTSVHMCIDSVWVCVCMVCACG